jgi:hypothetical protein
VDYAIHMKDANAGSGNIILPQTMGSDPDEGWHGYINITNNPSNFVVLRPKVLTGDSTEVSGIQFPPVSGTAAVEVFPTGELPGAAMVYDSTADRIKVLTKRGWRTVVDSLP